ncbi:MAG TPA: helix-turn-helix domain-containing protein [Actinomycetota bacterium]|nr:helix-turn-helix domain-containing protein [Actinomycetota bacterium]
MNGSRETRERVLRWKRRGKSARWIAAKIGIRPQTVYYHLHILDAAGELAPGDLRKYRARGER